MPKLSHALVAAAEPEVVARLRKVMADYDARLQAEKRPPWRAGQ